MNIKKDFPILNKNNIVFLDSTASTQKPSHVIDWIKDYLENSYSNIHRWAYNIAEISEDLYNESKEKVSDFIWANSSREIIYTYNSNYAVNIITQTLRFNKVLKKWDKVLLSIVEHHANIVPWLILKEELWIEIEYIWIDENYDLDMNDFDKKYDDSVKIISLTQVSNVTGQIFELEKIWKQKREDTLFIIDASQSIPHFNIDVQKLNCDFLFFTWHKLMADTWIWILWWKQELLKKLRPIFSWWWAINKVEETCFKEASIPDKFEAGTPNITGAVSLLKALEYIESLWWYSKLENIENELVEYSLKKFNKRKNIKLIWSNKSQNRVWVFSFIIEWVHSLDIADFLAWKNICIRAWQHCAEPFLNTMWLKHTCRMSLYIYNTTDDINRFFEVLDEAILELK